MTRVDSNRTSSGMFKVVWVADDPDLACPMAPVELILDATALSLEDSNGEVVLWIVGRHLHASQRQWETDSLLDLFRDETPVMTLAPVALRRPVEQTVAALEGLHARELG